MNAPNETTQKANTRLWGKNTPTARYRQDKAVGTPGTRLTPTYVFATVDAPAGWPARRVTTTRGDEGTVSDALPLSHRLPPVLTRRSCSGVSRNDTRREEAGVTRAPASEAFATLTPRGPTVGVEWRGGADAGATCGEEPGADRRPSPGPPCPACEEPREDKEKKTVCQVRWSTMHNPIHGVRPAITTYSIPSQGGTTCGGGRGLGARTERKRSQEKKNGRATAHSQVYDATYRKRQSSWRHILHRRYCRPKRRRRVRREARGTAVSKGRCIRTR